MATLLLQPRQIVYKTQQIKAGKIFYKALADLNKAYDYSRDLKPSAQLTAGNITYIKNTLS